MNKLALWFAKTQLPKITRYLLAALGAWLVKVGFEGDATNFTSLLSGLAAFGAAALWSVAHRIPGFDWVDKILTSLDLGDRATAMLWVQALAKKGIAALFVFLGTHGVQVDSASSTEAVLGIVLTWLLSALSERKS